MEKHPNFEAYQNAKNYNKKIEIVKNSFTEDKIYFDFGHKRDLKLEELRITFLDKCNGIFPLSMMQDLKKLILFTVHPIDLSPLKSLENLEFLEIKSNSMDLSFVAKLKNLTFLNLNGNQITDLSPLQNLINLQDLNIGSNQISDIRSLQYLTNLTQLTANGNEISDLSPLQNLTNLQSLYLRNNIIFDLNPLQNLTNLRYLNLDENEITDAKPLQNLQNLEKLHIYQNKIADSVCYLNKLTNLKHLEISKNEISDINCLKTLLKLEDIRFSWNKISDISVLENFKNITSLSSAYNQLKDIKIIANLEKLESLSLPGNLIEDICCVKNLKNLESIDIKENPIEDINFLNQLKKSVKYVEFTKPAKEKVSAKKEQKFSPELIILQDNTVADYRAALEQLFILSLNFDNLKEWYLVENPITFCKKENGDLILMNDYSLQDFISETDQIEELREMLQQFIHNLAITNVLGEECYLFTDVVAHYASLKKEYVKYFIEYMQAMDIECEMEEGSNIGEIIDAHGFCSETLDLLIGRHIDFAGQCGSDDFVYYLQNDLGEWLKDEENFNLFYQKFVKQLGYNAYTKEGAERDSKQAFDALFKDKDEAKKWFEKSMQEYEKYNAEKEEVEKAISEAYLSGEIEQRKEATKYLDKVLEMKSSHGLRMLSNVYHAIAREYVIALCGGGKEWNEEFDKALRTGLEYELMALKLSVPLNDDNYKSKKNLISTIYNNLGNSYIKSGYAAKEKENKIKYFETSIYYTKQALKYRFDGPYNCMNFSSAIVNLIDLGNKQEQVIKYQGEIDYFNNIILGFDKINNDNITVYNNACALYQRTLDKLNILKYLEKCLETNKKVKEYKKEYFTDDHDYEFVRNEPKFQELIEKYFPSKKKAKQKKEVAEAKNEMPVNAEIEQFVKNLKKDFNLTVVLTKDEKDIEIEFDGDDYDKYYTPEIKKFANDNTQQIVEYLISKKDDYKKVLLKLGKLNNVKITKSSCQIDKDGSLWGLLLRNLNLTDISPLLEFPDILSIDLSDNKLTDLNGLKTFKDLVRLTARDNKINDISVFESLSKIRELNLEDNKITEITVFKYLSNLKNIQISKNEISDISPLADALKLEFFWAAFNKIKDISPLKNAEKLYYLNLWNNPVESIEVLKGKQLLRTLYIDKTNVKDISPLKGLEKLEYLNISENEIDDLSPLLDIPNLRELVMDKIIVADYSPLLEMSNLKSITISNSVITEHPEIKTYLTKMGCNISERD